MVSPSSGGSGSDDEQVLLDLLHSVRAHRHRTVKLLIQVEELIVRRLVRGWEKYPDLVCETCYEKLTPRERNVADLLRKGMSNRMIARSLDISEQTAKNHLHSIFRKLGVADRTQAVIALMCGIKTDTPES
ncbi:LuxR C-terminal-related transcriptional regulator [Actinosynnema sp. NPDC091369]